MNASNAVKFLISNIGAEFGVRQTASNIGGNENFSLSIKKVPSKFSDVANKIEVAAKAAGFAPGAGMFPFVTDTTDPIFYVEKKGKNGGEVVAVTLKGTADAPRVFVEPCGVLDNSIL